MIALLLGLFLGLGMRAAPAFAQEADPTNASDDRVDDGAPAGSAPLTGSAVLLSDGQPAGQVPFSVRPDGPRFALEPIAALFGVELRVGPLGDAHTLIFTGGKEVRLGPEHQSYVVVSEDGSEEVRYLDRPPTKGISGLMVPLGMLRDVLAKELGYQVSWDFQRLQLAVERRELREIRASLDLIHQFRTSTLELVLQMSERPRFRFERLDHSVELEMVGDRLVLGQPFVPSADDPLVRSVTVEPTRIVVALRDQAAAAEPRVVPGDGEVRVVLDVYRQRARPAGDDTVDAPPLPRAFDSSTGIRTIVLDPGHGGEETGAIGKSGAVESELTLRVARLLATRLENRLAGVDVVLTRELDVDIPLETRVAIANERKADLFISLHFNSYLGSQARGAETYFLSREASDRVAEEVVAAENSSMSAEERREMADLELILWDLAQTFHLAESQRFANLVQEELNLTLGLRDRGVRQAPFRVLMGANMPAVLVELGFLSNPDEETKLQSPAYLGELVDSLVRSISRFKTQMEARRGPQPPFAPPPPVPSPATGGGQP